MDPNNAVRYRFIPGRRRAPRLNGQRQLTGREIVAIRQRHHQQRNRQAGLQHQGVRRQVVQELLEVGIRVPIPLRPIGRLPVAVPAPERPPRPRRPAPPMVENPVIEVPLLRPQPEDEPPIPDYLGYGGWQAQPNFFGQQLRNVWPGELGYPVQYEPWPPAYNRPEPLAPEGAPLLGFHHQPRELMNHNLWPVRFWGQDYPEPLPVDPYQQREGNQQQAAEMAPLGDNVLRPEAAACRTQCGRLCDHCRRPNENVQRPVQEEGQPQEDGQSPRHSPAPLNSGPAESGAAARSPVQGLEPGVVPTVGGQPNNVPLELSCQLNSGPAETGAAPRPPVEGLELNSVPADVGTAARSPVEGLASGVSQTVGAQPINNTTMELSGQLPATNQAAVDPPHRSQTEGAGSEFRARSNFPSESAVYEPPQELSLEPQEVGPPQPLLEEAPLEPFSVLPNNRQPQEVVQTAGATALLPVQPASVQEPASQAGDSLPNLHQNNNNTEPAESLPTNNDELWAQVLEFLADCGEI